MRLATLVVDIAANLARLQSDMQQAKGVVESGVRDMQRSALALKRTFESVLVGTGAAMFARQMVQAASEAEQSQLRLQAVLRATGFQLGITRQELDRMAESMQDALGFDDESIRNAQSQLVKFGNIHGDVFREAIKLSADLAAFMGSNIPEAAQMIGKTLQSPTEGLTMMERQFGKLTEAEEAHIKSLVAQGRAIEAQNAVLDLWRQKVGGVAAEMNTGLTGATKGVANAWNDLLETFGKTGTEVGRVEKSLRGLQALMNDISAESQGKGSPLSTWWVDIVGPVTDFWGITKPGDRDKLRVALQQRGQNPHARTGMPLSEWREPGPTSPAPLGGKTPEDALRERARELERLRQLGLKSAEEDLRGQHELLDLKDELIRRDVERNKKERERLELLAKESAIADLLAQQARLDERDEIERSARLREKGEREKAEAEAAKKLRDEMDRTAQRVERSLSTAIVTGIMHGGELGGEVLKKALEAAVADAVLTPMLKPILDPIAGAVSSAAGQIFGTAGAGGGVMPSWVGPAALGLGGAYMMATAQGRRTSQIGGAMSGAAIGSMIMPGIGTAIGAGAGALFGDAIFGGGDDGPQYTILLKRDEQGWYAQTGEDGGYRVLQRFPGIDENVLRGMPQRTGYWEQGGHGEPLEAVFQRYMQRIAPAVLPDIDLLNKQQSTLYQQLMGMASPEALGISTLKSFRDALAISPDESPEDRLAAARAQYGAVIERADMGDLDAIRELPNVAGMLIDILRQNYASGAEFQTGKAGIEEAVDRIMKRQEDVRLEFLKDVPASIQQASIDQVKQLRETTATLSNDLQEVRKAIERWQSVQAP